MKHVTEQNTRTERMLLHKSLSQHDVCPSSHVNMKMSKLQTDIRQSISSEGLWQFYCIRCYIYVYGVI